MPDGRPDSSQQPLTDEQIIQNTIGKPDVLNGPITLVEYDQAWPEHFAREARRMSEALGPRAVRIEHIGSTSVPGLVAKPIIDILLVVADSADEPSYVPALEGAGYVLRIREPDWHQHRLFKGPDTNINMHVYTVGSVEIERYLIFRDWLRDHPAERDLYAHTKRDLAQREWRYVQNYADAKSEVVEEIIARALAALRS
ncbi:MAG: GrpB family protein [Chloroflexi bacterium]|nr:GrpB family protein [Chloroflexota bacterium]